MDFPGRLIAGFVAIIMILIFPLQYMAQSTNENIDSQISNFAHALSDDICNKGYLDENMYEGFTNKLDLTGEKYFVDLEDIHPVTGEEIDTVAGENKTGGYNKISVANNAAQKSKTVSNTKVTIVNRAEDTVKLNNEKITLNLLASSSPHTHTDDCYSGHRHNLTCHKVYIQWDYSTAQSGVTNTISVYCAACNNMIMKLDTYAPTGNHRTGITTTYYDYYNGVVVEKSYIQLAQQTSYYNGEFDAYNTAVTNETNKYIDLLHSSGFIVKSFNQNQYATWFTHVSNNITWGGLSIPCFGNPTPYSYDLTYANWNGCLKCNNYSCGLVQDENPLCNQVVTSITATNPIQTAAQGSSIISTATATILDGSTKTVNCTVSGYDSSKVGTQTATLTYTGLVGNAKSTGTRTCTVNVTVLSTKTLSSLSVTPTTQIIMRNSKPTFTVIAKYSDGTSKTLTNTQYTMSAFDPSTPGVHTITITYSENGITKIATATVCVDQLSSVVITPATQLVERYTPISSLSFTAVVTYLYGANKTITSGLQISGYSPNILGEQNVTVSYTENGITKAASVKVTVTVLHRECPRCHNTYDFTVDDVDPGCPYCKQLITGITAAPEYVEVSQGDTLPITVTAIYSDGSTGTVTGWTSNYDASVTGLQLVTIEYAGYAANISVWVNESMIICPLCGTKYPTSQGRCPVCSRKVISISAFPNEITVNQNVAINLTVTATYADGRKEVVTDWSIDRSTSKAGTFTATISYNGVTTTIILHVISATAVTCPICGIIYEPSENPRGCPDCSSTIVGIEAYLTSGSNLVQYGSTPSIDVVLIFLDSHRELVSDGFTINDYNSHLLGSQTITVVYDGFDTSLDIVVVNTMQAVTCPKGHVYYFNDDGSDPGCPYCALAKEVGTVYYFDINYLNDIEEKIYSDGIYYFDSGNFITLKVSKGNRSLLTNIQNMFFKTAMIGRRKEYTIGGEVS